MLRRKAFKGILLLIHSIFFLGVSYIQPNSSNQSPEIRQILLPQPTLHATVQNLVALATWRPGFVHPCCRCHKGAIWRSRQIYIQIANVRRNLKIY